MRIAQTNVNLPLDHDSENHNLLALNNNNNNNNFPQQILTKSRIIVRTSSAEILDALAPTRFLKSSKAENKFYHNLEKGTYYIVYHGNGYTYTFHHLPEVEPGVPNDETIANLVRNSHTITLNTQNRFSNPRQNYDLINLDHHIIVVMYNPNARTPAMIRNNFAFVREWNDQNCSFRIYRNQTQLKNNNNGLINVTKVVPNPSRGAQSLLMRDNNGNAYCISDTSSQCNTGFTQRVNLPNNNNNVAPFVEDEYIGQDNTYYFLEQNNVIEAMSPTGMFSQATVEDLMPGEVLVGFAHRYIYNDETYLQSSLKRYFSLSYSSLAGTGSEVVATPVTPANTRELVSDTNATYYDYLDPHDHEYHYEVFGYANKDGIPDTPDGYISPSNAHFLFKSKV
jgi:hypothetical protein